MCSVVIQKVPKKIKYLYSMSTILCLFQIDYHDHKDFIILITIILDIANCIFRYKNIYLE